RYLEVEPLVRVRRPEAVEVDPARGLLRRKLVDALDLQQGEIALPVLRGPHQTLDRIAGAQVEALDLRRADVDVVRPVEVAPVRRAQEPVAFGQDLEHALAPQLDVV